MDAKFRAQLMILEHIEAEVDGAHDNFKGTDEELAAFVEELNAIAFAIGARIDRDGGDK